MVATETIDAEQQLQVRIIRTKGGIKNVAYITDNDSSLIVHQSTTSSASTTSAASTSSFSENIVAVGEDGALNDISECELATIPKLPFNTSNIADQSHFSKEYHSKDKSMQKVEFRSIEINVEVEAQKVHHIKKEN